MRLRNTPAMASSLWARRRHRVGPGALNLKLYLLGDMPHLQICRDHPILGAVVTRLHARAFAEDFAAWRRAERSHRLLIFKSVPAFEAIRGGGASVGRSGLEAVGV